MAWQGFQAPAPQVMHHKNNQVPEGKIGGASNHSDDGIKAATGKYSSTMGQTLALESQQQHLFQYNLLNWYKYKCTCCW